MMGKLVQPMVFEKLEKAENDLGYQMQAGLATYSLSLLITPGY